MGIAGTVERYLGQRAPFVIDHLQDEIVVGVRMQLGFRGIGELQVEDGSLLRVGCRDDTLGAVDVGYLDLYGAIGQLVVARLVVLRELLALVGTAGLSADLAEDVAVAVFGFIHGYLVGIVGNVVSNGHRVGRVHVLAEDERGI